MGRKRSCSKKKTQKRSNKKTKKKPSVTKLRLNGRRYEFFHDNFLDMKQMREFLINLKKQYPTKIQIQCIGNSDGNNPIFLVRISESSGSDEQKLATFIEAGSNGCDLYSVSAALYLIDYMVKNTSFSKIMDYLVIPCLNPDAYISVLNKKQPKNIAVNLSNNYPIALGLSSLEHISMETFLKGIATWRQNHKYGSKETLAIRKAINIYQSTIRLFISIQEEGEKIVYPNGLSNYEVNNLENIKKVAKSGQMGIKRRCFNVGSVYELCGVTFGTVIDFLNIFQNINFTYIIHMNTKVAEPNPKKILSYGEDITNAIKLMARTVYLLDKRYNPKHYTSCDYV